MFSKLNYVIYAKIETLQGLFNLQMKKIYSSTANLSLDDDLLKWTGTGGFKVKIDLKAAKTGILAYKLIDSNRIACFYLFGDSEALRKRMVEAKIEKRNVAIMQLANEALSTGPYEIICDAGIFSNFENVRYLTKPWKKVCFRCFPTGRKSSLDVAESEHTHS